MKTFTLEVAPWGELMGSLSENEGAAITTVRVNQNDYDNLDDKLIPEAFRYSAELLQSCSSTVQVAESSATLTYSEDLECDPPAVVSADRIHSHLQSLGYRRKVNK